LEKIIELVQWAADNRKIEGIGFQAVTQPFSTPEDSDWYKNPEFEFLWPKDMDLVTEVMEGLMHIKNENRYKDNFQIFNPVNQFKVFIEYFRNPQKFIKQDTCHLDERAINITPTGEVHICFYKPPIGNIKTADIRDIWFSREAGVVRSEIKSCRRNCQALVNCNFDEEESYVV
jgi:MoaA/NifB/PqqE/SkfB family radical SAM enzyme